MVLRSAAQKNGHVVFERNFYSVPYTNIGRTVDLRITDTTSEVFAGDQRLTSHLLAPAGMVNEYRTHDSDLPDGPRYQQMDPERAREWAARIGENTTTIVNRIFESVPVDEQGLGAALAVLRMTRRYSAARVEAAAAIALALAGEVATVCASATDPGVQPGPDRQAAAEVRTECLGGTCRVCPRRRLLRGRRSMSRLDAETKRKLREMGVPALVDAIDIQDDALTIGMVFEERIKLAVDDAHAAFTHSKVEGLIRRAGLRYPNADLRESTCSNNAAWTGVSSRSSGPASSSRDR